MNKVYAILHNSYEFDDVSYGDLTPSFMSLNKKTVIKEFNRIKESEIKSFEDNIKKYEEYLNVCPERKEDFQIVTNKDDELEIYFDNWCSHWVITEYELH